MLVPVSISDIGRTTRIPITVRPMGWRLEDDLNRLRESIAQLAVTNPGAALYAVNILSRVVGRSL